MSKVRACGLALIFLHTSFMPVLAQERETVTQGIEWFSVNSIFHLNSKLAFLAEGHLRLVQNFQPMQIQVRTGPEVTLSKHLSIIPLGYAYTWNPLYGKQPNTFVNNEHRMFQQAVVKHGIQAVKLNHRVRLEQRFLQVHTIENNEIVDHGYDMYTNRLRYKLQAQLPIAARADGSPMLDAVVSDEMFVSFGNNVTYHKPDQNRLYGGVLYYFHKNLSIQGGPFYQLLIKSGGTKQENNVGFNFSLSHSMELSE